MERLAMTRVAPLAGNQQLANEACHIIRDHAWRRPLPRDAVEQVLSMRQRLEEHVSGRDHLKRGLGAIWILSLLLSSACCYKRKQRKHKRKPCNRKPVKHSSDSRYQKCKKTPLHQRQPAKTSNHSSPISTSIVLIPWLS